MKRSLRLGLACSVVGFGVGLYVALNATGQGYEAFPVAAAAASFFTAIGVWKLAIERHPAPSRTRGAVAGALVALLAHHLTWWLLSVYLYAGALLSPAFRASSGELPMNPLVATVLLAPITLWSWVLFGWLTVPAGALLGALFARDRAALPASGGRVHPV